MYFEIITVITYDELNVLQSVSFYSGYGTYTTGNRF